MWDLPLFEGWDSGFLSKLGIESIPGWGMLKITMGITGLSKNLDRDNRIEEPYWGYDPPSSSVFRLLNPSLVLTSCGVLCLPDVYSLLEQRCEGRFSANALITSVHFTVRIVSHFIIIFLWLVSLNVQSISFLQITTQNFYQPKWKQPCLIDDFHWWPRPHQNRKSQWLQNFFDDGFFFLGLRKVLYKRSLQITLGSPIQCCYKTGRYFLSKFPWSVHSSLFYWLPWDTMVRKEIDILLAVLADLSSLLDFWNWYTN